MIIAILAIPFSAFAAELKRGSDFWYSIGNVSGETFTVDGNTAYCVNPLLPIPASGNYTATQINNVNLMKVLYYGYGGVGFNNTTKAKMDSYHNNQNITASGRDLYYGLTRRCAAKAYGSNYKFKLLAGAEFTIKYYDTLDDISGKTPKAHWTLKTDADGYAGLSSEYLIEGSAFYQTGSGNPCIPLGTVTIQETKAPAGYHNFQNHR